jgi:hypothetical protein
MHGRRQIARWRHQRKDSFWTSWLLDSVQDARGDQYVATIVADWRSLWICVVTDLRSLLLQSGTAVRGSLTPTAMRDGNHACTFH